MESQVLPNTNPLLTSKETIGFSRMESQFLPNTNSLLTSKETIGFSRMESQFLPNTNPLLTSKETIGFSRMESQFQPKQGRTKERLKLRLHAAKVGGLSLVQSQSSMFLT